MAPELAHINIPGPATAVGGFVMVTDVVVVNPAHPPVGVIVYVTVYVPAVLVPGLIAPVAPLSVKPAVEVNVPPVDPVMVTFVIPVFTQNGEPV